MGYHPTTKSRQYTEGWQGRRRTYQCRECLDKFQVDTLKPLAEVNRVCPSCRLVTQVFIFKDRRTDKERAIRAPNAEIATLRAWRINRNLSFEVPQPIAQEEYNRGIYERITQT